MTKLFPLLITVLVTAFAGVLLSADSDGRVPVATCEEHLHKHEVVPHKRMLDRIFERSDWRDRAIENRKQRQRIYHQRSCAVRAHARFRMKRYFEKVSEGYSKWRQRKKFQAKWTPFKFGEPTIRWVAIPQYIVRCETRGYYGRERWNVVNPSSGARDAYQMLPSTYYTWSNKDDWSRKDQHKTARKIYLGAGASQWECA